ncbi:MAG TPA: aminopeptidase P family N-terminal domain-containing protein, partial [Chlamydiales bacterium]|nr:aminopeptidase P family N-terminal domain-containing protein [Chlamydiales bacterium]
MKKRIEKLQKNLTHWHADALYITTPQDLFYLTGLQMSKGVLVVEKKKAHLIVDGRYFEACKKNFSGSVHLEEPSTLTKVLKGCNALAFDGDVETVNGFEKLAKKCGEVISYIPLSKPVLEIRMVKEKEEIEKIKRACDLCTEGFDYVVERLRVG